MGLPRSFAHYIDAVDLYVYDGLGFSLAAVPDGMGFFSLVHTAVSCPSRLLIDHHTLHWFYQRLLLPAAECWPVRLSMLRIAVPCMARRSASAPDRGYRQT